MFKLPQDRADWVLPKKKQDLTEDTDRPDLPSDLRRMSERQRLDLMNYLRNKPLQELKRRQDVIHAQQSEMHQHLRYYGKNSSYVQASANLEIMDDMYRRVIELVDEDYTEMLNQKYGSRTPSWDYKAWGLPQPDTHPDNLPTDEHGIVTAKKIEVDIEDKYNVKFPNWGLPFGIKK